MNYIKKNNSYILKFDQDEKLVQLIEEFVIKHRIKFGWLSGLGACKGAELGFYDLENQDYKWQTFTELSEITNLTGNVSWLKDEPKVHIHITLSDNKFNTYGGHLKELIVGGTVELKLDLVEHKISRVFDEKTGLNTLEL